MLSLNITFLWIGQVLYPSFIAEMRRPQDFPKALAALTVMEFILFMVAAAVGYNYLGQYSTARESSLYQCCNILANYRIYSSYRLAVGRLREEGVIRLCPCTHAGHRRYLQQRCSQIYLVPNFGPR